ncbi:hypothetical protein G3T14_01585 [Methylobacterium sp. BTF04]|uniref:hypothetical protein n=1 Tax=Methylobacterium sp. BTF04 TaxID=2708300 RepID=UPI0013D68B6F|nr:hypothetical protein [Methylobacterium sp. BTF04]NEU10824.1 hypothetical protein [Methylobacterium sp. BTF04]
MTPSNLAAGARDGRMVHRSARLGHLPFAAVIVVVAVPNLLFLATHLASPLLAIGCIGCVLASLVFLLRDLARIAEPLDGQLLIIALIAGFALCCLGGQAHLFFANDDWLIRDAVLHDLVAQPWPVGYRYDGDATVLRAPLGLYLVPAAIGKILGLAAGHAALLGQNGILFGCLFYGFGRAFPPRRRSLWVLVVFVLFGGWDVVGTWLLGKPLDLGRHIENWMPSLQFSSHVTQIFWVPNHAASGWAFVAAYLLWHRGRLSAASLICVFGLCAFWSPLSMIGALPFLARATLADLAGGRFGLRDLAHLGFTGLGLLPIALYLVADGGRVAHGLAAIDANFLIGYGVFIALELGPALLILRLARPDAAAEGSDVLGKDMPLIVGLLLLVPFYRIGMNDFVMRASIPALALLALRFGQVTAKAAPFWRVAATVAVIAVGAGAPLQEIVRALRTPTFSISTCNLLTAGSVPPNDGPLFHYLARLDVIQNAAAGRVLATPQHLLAPEKRGLCWPDRIDPNSAP